MNAVRCSLHMGEVSEEERNSCETGGRDQTAQTHECTDMRGKEHSK